MRGPNLAEGGGVILQKGGGGFINHTGRLILNIQTYRWHACLGCETHELTLRNSASALKRHAVQSHPCLSSGVEWRYLLSHSERNAGAGGVGGKQNKKSHDIQPVPAQRVLVGFHECSIIADFAGCCN